MCSLSFSSDFVGALGFPCRALLFLRLCFLSGGPGVPRLYVEGTSPPLVGFVRAEIKENLDAREISVYLMSKGSINVMNLRPRSWMSGPGALHSLWYESASKYFHLFVPVTRRVSCAFGMKVRPSTFIYLCLLLEGFHVRFMSGRNRKWCFYTSTGSGYRIF